MTVRLLQGDCIERMRELADASVDSVVTDPPYHLTTGKKGGTGPASVNLESPYGRARVTTGFMGMQWDGGDIAFRREVWAECLRVLKPGGYLLAFSGTRTYHRMVCAIEDAGFEIRDQIQWVYSSGFPKSHNLDNLRGTEHCGCEEARPDPSTAKGTQGGAWPVCRGCGLPILPRGLGTALKPAHEPIVVARKPLTGTVAANVLAHGTGGLNIEGCRVGTESTRREKAGGRGQFPHEDDAWEPKAVTAGSDAGRWPANLIHDGSDEVLAAFQKTTSVGHSPAARGRGGLSTSGHTGQDELPERRHDTGSAARFFYCAKADRADRNEGLADPGPQFKMGRMPHDAEAVERRKRGNHHPTVKPTDLMRYLCRLVTPKGGTVLDPFAGSGSTLKAAELEGFSAIGIELNAEYIEIARRRIAADAPLFAEVAA